MAHKSEFFRVLNHLERSSSLLRNVESTSKLNFEGANTPMDSPGSYSKLIYHGDIVYEG